MGRWHAPSVPNMAGSMVSELVTKLLPCARSGSGGPRGGRKERETGRGRGREREREGEEEEAEEEGNPSSPHLSVLEVLVGEVEGEGAGGKGE